MSPELPRRAIIRLAANVRVRYLRSERPPIEYAITLESRAGDTWTTIRLWDNADGLDTHHEHAYTESGGKQPPVVRAQSSTNEAMAAAIRIAATDWEAIVERWKDAR